MYQLVFLGLLSLAATTTAKHGTPRLHSHRDKGSAPDYSPSYGSGNVKQRKALVHDYWQDEVIDNFRDTAQKSHDDFVDYFRQLDKEHPAWYHGYVYWWHTVRTNKTAFAYNTWGSGPCDCCGGSYDRQYYANIPGYYYYFLFREPSEDVCRNNRSVSTAAWIRNDNIKQKFQQWVTEQEKERPPISTVAYVKDQVIEIRKAAASFRAVIVTYTHDADLVSWKDGGVNSGSFILQAKGSDPEGTYTMFLIQ